MGPENAPPTSPAAPSTTPPYVPPPPHIRRLTRSSRERMWAGVAGGMAEYFDIDPVLMRVLWIAATIVSSGLAVPVYILAWILMPRDDRPHAAADYVVAPPPPPEQEWWTSEHYRDRHRGFGHHPRSTGIVLIALGVLLLAANAGLLRWIDLRTMWPLIFIGLGLILLGRQSGWGR